MAVLMSLQLTRDLEELALSEKSLVAGSLGASSESIHKLIEEAHSIANECTSDHQKKVSCNFFLTDFTHVQRENGYL